MSETPSAETDGPERTDYETRMGEHYDPARVDPVFGGTPCPATHPVTGRPCVYPEGHYDHHWAMGERRMQLFGPDLEEARVTPPALSDPAAMLGA